MGLVEQGGQPPPDLLGSAGSGSDTANSPEMAMPTARNLGAIFPETNNCLEHASQTCEASKSPGTVCLEKRTALSTPVRHVGL